MLNATTTPERIHPFFLNHGAPTLPLETDSHYHKQLKQLSTKLSSQPIQAIVIFTAHWELSGGVVGITYTNDTLDTIHDFYGFPQALYEMKYPAKGSIKVAERVESLLHAHQIATERDETRGLDHGSWVLLKILFPQCNIPVVQCSVDSNATPRDHYRIGQALAPLAQEGVLVIGSGALLHNLARFRRGGHGMESWAVEFDDWMQEKVLSWHVEDLFRYDELCPHARVAVPRSEHLVPLFVAMGVSDGVRQASVFDRTNMFNCFSTLSFEF